MSSVVVGKSSQVPVIAPVLVPAPPAAEAAVAPSPRRVFAHARRYEWLASMGMVFVHLLPLGAFWSGVTWPAVAWAAAWYGIRMFAITGGFHRYFSHRSYKTSRWFQFVLAFLAQTTGQRSVLWWAAKHRHHHRFSDQPEDVHSPKQDGLWYAHVGWVYNHNDTFDMDDVKDLAKFPELVWLHRYWWLPTWALGLVSYLVLGWPGVFIGFGLSTVFTWHCTFFINSLTHVFGRRRYATTDDSRNSFILALVCFGEGWHNNHHHYMHSTRQGFFWWEIDITFYVLKMLSWVGIVWDLRPVPARVLMEAKHGG